MKIRRSGIPLVWCWPVLKDAAAEWSRLKTSQMGAALAFFSVFSIAPVLIMALDLTGWILGPEAAQSRIDIEIEQYVGKGAAAAIQSMVVAASRPGSNGMVTTLNWLALLFGAFGMFSQMQDAMNAAWDVVPDPNRNILKLVRARLPAFLMMFGIAGLALALVIVNTILTTLSHYASARFPGFLAVAKPLNDFGSVIILTVLFALIFRFLPEIQVAWKDVWFGSVVTAILFTIGKYAIGYYLTTAAIQSAYGAAGSLAVVLLWAYYSSQILFFGAEITQAYAHRHGSRSGLAI